MYSIACTKESVEPESGSENTNNTIETSHPEETSWEEALKGIHVWDIEVGSTFNPNYTKSTHAFLCPNGYFYMSVVDHITGSEFEGVWSVESKPLNQPAVLTVQFTDGDIRYYELGYINNTLFIESVQFQFEYSTEKC